MECPYGDEWKLEYSTTKFIKEIEQLGANNALNGKIVAECDFEVEEIKYMNDTSAWRYTNTINYFYSKKLTNTQLRNQSQVLENEMMEYFKPKENGKVGYAIHIENLKERVMELSDVYIYDNSYNNMFGWIIEENEKYIPLEKAPQNMCRVWIYENGKWVMYILISVRPEWLCKILNGEKTIEVRKRVLRGMVKR